MIMNESYKRWTRRAGIAVATAALVVFGTLTAAGAAPVHPSVSPTKALTGQLYGCATEQSPHYQFWFHGTYTGKQHCGAGHQLVVWSVTGPQGATGAQGPQGDTGATGAQGPAGPAGSTGAAGASEIQTVTGTTSVTAWPETSGWAIDAFVRTVSVTSHGAVDNSHCSGAPKCFFFTFTLSDNGSFTTVDGKPTPNGTGGTISGVSAGTMQGVAGGQFYADSDAMTGTVPVSATGDDKPASTTTWATLVMTSGAHTYGVTLTAYSWQYADGQTCETWTDAINPGDDGQSAADGNITGVVACTS